MVKFLSCLQLQGSLRFFCISLILICNQTRTPVYGNPETINSKPAVKPNEASNPPEAYRVLTEIQKRLLTGESLAPLLNPDFRFNQEKGVPSTESMKLCSIWYEFSQVNPPAYEESVRKPYTQSPDQIQSLLKRQITWLPTKRPRQSHVTILLGDRFFAFDEKTKKLDQALCWPARWDQLDALPARILQASPGGPENDGWMRQLRRWAFYTAALAPLYSRLWTAFMTEDPATTLKIWAPLSKLTLMWLKEGSEASRPENQINRDLQRVMATLKTTHLRLAPQAYLQEAAYFKVFYFEDVFKLWSETYHFAQLAQVWHTKSYSSSPDSLDREFQLFLNQEQKALLDCCFTEKGLKELQPHEFPKTPQSDGLVSPPPL